jgi:hypothetical protein
MNRTATPVFSPPEGQRWNGDGQKWPSPKSQGFACAKSWFPNPMSGAGHFNSDVFSSIKKITLRDFPYRQALRGAGNWCNETRHRQFVGSGKAAG